MSHWLHRWRWWILLALFWSLVAAGLVGYARHSRNTLLQAELQRLGTQTLVIEETLKRQINAVDATLRAITSHAPRGRRGPTDRAQDVALLKTLKLATPWVRSFLILDAQGTVIASNHEELVGRNFAARDPVQAPARAPSSATLYVSPPQPSVNDTLELKLTHVVLSPQGAFAGAASAALDPQEMYALLNSARYSDDMRVRLMHSDGAVFVAAPVNGEGAKSGLPLDSALLAPLLAVNAPQLRLLPVHQDAERGPQLMALRRIATTSPRMDKPLIVALTRQHAAVLAEWYTEQMGLGTGWLLTVLFSIWGLARIQRDRALKIMESKRLKLATEAGRLGVWEFDLINRVYQWDERMFALFGLDPKRMSERNDDWIRLLPEDDLRRMRAATRETIQHDKPFKMTFRIRRPDGQIRFMRNRAAIYRDDHGVPRRLIGVTEDVTERKQQEADLRVAAVAFETNQSMLVTNAQVEVLRINQAFVQLFGYGVADMLGQHPRKLKSGRQDTPFYQAMWEQLLAQRHWQGEVWNTHKDGHDILCWMGITAVCDDRGNVTHYVAHYTDITQRKASEEEVRRMAFFDALTQLPNRRLLQDRLRQALAKARRDGATLAVLYVDLDKFKPVNDLYGHAVGDHVLREVALRLLSCLRESDTAARVGGDEFVVLLPQIAQAEDAYRVAEKIHAQLRRPFDLPAGQTAQMSSSIGIALFPEHAQDETRLSHCADVAMYHAKAAGRDQYVVYGPALDNDLQPATR
ncbi:MAG: hypothetical protein OHK0048_26550 [Rhodoferax sp.]